MIKQYSFEGEEHDGQFPDGELPSSEGGFRRAMTGRLRRRQEAEERFATQGVPGWQTFNIEEGA